MLHCIDLKKKINLENQALQCRLWIIEMLTQAKSSHLGCSFSIVDILVVLYHQILSISLIENQSVDRDFFILSKGHGAAALYAVLASVNLISQNFLNKYHNDGTFLTGHPMRDISKGIEASTGSLGHGLSMGVGLALAAVHDQRPSHVYVLVGDGECQEGSVWEALMMAVRFQLDNLTLIVDDNNLQGLDKTSDIAIGSWKEKFQAWGCRTSMIDGHDYIQLITVLSEKKMDKKPHVIIAKTQKGKGISFMQNKLEWHYKSCNAEQYSKGRKELDESCAIHV